MLPDCRRPGGFPQFRDFVPKEDAVIVSRVKSAGAVLLGKTNVPLGLTDFQSYNDVYGTTNNPWDTSRSPTGPRAGLPRPSPPALDRCRSDRTLADRCACLRTSAASTRTNRRSA